MRFLDDELPCAARAGWAQTLGLPIASAHLSSRPAFSDAVERVRRPS